jgi:hypothetical protein
MASDAPVCAPSLVCADSIRSSGYCCCSRLPFGRHTTEEAAARMYNVEAERFGVALNIIPPAGALGTGAGGGGGAGVSARPEV